MTARPWRACRPGPWAGLLAGLLALSACPNRDQPVAFAPRQPDPAQVREQIERDRQELADYKPAGQAERVLQFFYRANLLSASPGGSTAQALQEQMTGLRMAAKACLLEQGQQTVRKLGLFLLAGFERELDALAQASGGVPGAAAALLTGAAPPEALRPAFERFARLGGRFLVLAAANDLVRQGKDQALVVPPASRFFIRLAFKVYWANVLPEVVRAIDWMLSDFERRWYEIWVLERSKSAPLHRKLAAIAYLEKHDPGFSAPTARGIVLFQSQRWAEAIAAFEQALKEHPGDQRLEAFLAEAKRRAR